MLPIGGKKTLKSYRWTNSGYILPVCSYKFSRSLFSVILKRFAISGRYQTGSIAIFVTQALPFDKKYFSSTLINPFSADSYNSGRRMWAFVTAIVGLISNPASKCFLNAV